MGGDRKCSMAEENAGNQGGVGGDCKQERPMQQRLWAQKLERGKCRLNRKMDWVERDR